MEYSMERRMRQGAPPSRRTATDSAGVSSHPLLHLQQQTGNQALQELLKAGVVQAKLAVSRVDSFEEQEAERIAEQVTRPPESDAAQARESLRIKPAGSELPGLERASVPPVVGEALQSSGHPLDSATRAFFEPRFGRDLSGVRIHTGADAAESARSIRAHAYTTGADIVFASGQYSPATASGRSLLAHELAHVLQRQSRSPAAIFRQPGPVQDAPESEINYAAASDDTIRQQVDDAVRKLYHLSGPGLTSRNVNFLEEPQFAAQLSNRNLADSLRNIFAEYGNLDPGSIPWQILNVYEGEIMKPRPIHGYSNAAIDRVISRGIKDGYFEYHSVPTIDENGIQRITVRDLVTGYLQGATDISGPRSKRKIRIQTSGGVYNVATLVHEACHYYVSDAFQVMALSWGDKYEYGGALITSTLLEGFAEFFASRVMQAHREDFGSPSKAYPLQTEQAARLAATLGEDSIEAAYFGGNALQLKRLTIAVEEYTKISPDLLVPGSVVDSILSGTQDTKSH